MRKKAEAEKEFHENIVKTEYSEEMKKSFLDYSMSVIVARAIPDIRDGLKPVHRRILYIMNEIGQTSDKPYKKCANVVGTCLSKVHPHGDSSVYGSLVNMTHEYSLTRPLIDGHGNFGSVEGDPCAAYRYTECRLEKYTEDVFLKDLTKQTVDFVPNFDNSFSEPEVLPASLPNVLINGSEGIAVGMVTSTPPHNLGEVIEAYKLYISNPKTKTEDYLTVLKGPDFPTGGIIVNKSDLSEIYKTGTGKIRIRGKIEFEPAQGRGDRDKLIITEIPYTMIGQGIKKFLSDVADLAKSKVLPEVIDILNQTSGKGIRLVIEVKQGSDIDRIKNILYKKTKLEDTFSVNMLYISEKRPEVCGLQKTFSKFYQFQTETKQRKYQAILCKQKEIVEIREGLIKAIDVIDVIIEILRGSKTIKIAKDCLMGIDTTKVSFKTKKNEAIAKKLSFTDIQAQAILDMKLSRLINLELNSLIKEKEEALKTIAKCEKVLKSKKEMDKIIISEIDNIKTQYATKRKTKITNANTVDIDTNIIQENDVYVCYDKFGYFKTYDDATYERNKENIMETNKALLTKNTDTVFIFTNKGNVHQIKVNDIPLCRARDRGTPADNISNYNSSKEQIVQVFSGEELNQNKLLFVTKHNCIKQVFGNEFITSRKTITSTKLMGENDEVIAVNKITNTLMILSTDGYILKIKIEEIPEQKRNSAGVRCMKLKDGEDIKQVFSIDEKTKEININDKTISVSKIRYGKRATSGQKFFK